MKILKSVAYLSIILSLCFAFSGCGTAPQSNANSSASNNAQVAGKRGGSLTYRFTTPIKTLNFYMSDDEPSVVLAYFLLNDKLVTLDHEKQAYVRSLAESYTVAADGRTVDVVLREGLKFSDGKPITTADVEFSLKGAYGTRTKSAIFPAALLVGGKQIEAKVADERRMQLIFPEKVAAVENYLENLGILPKHILDSDLQAGRLSESMTISADPATIVTSGPFMVDSVVAGEKVTLKRNPNYWKKDAAGTQLPYLDTLVLEVVPDPNNTMARLQQNTIDIADRIRASDFAALKTAPSGAKPHDAGPGLNTDHIWFNLNAAKKSGESLESTPKHKWFADKRFRRAVAHAIDRRSIAENTLQGLASPLYGFVPLGNRKWMNANAPKADYDLERAKALLIEAGFEGRDNGGKLELFDPAGNRVEFTLIVPAENEPRKLMAAVVQEDLARIGMNVSVAPIDFQSLSKAWNETFEYDAILLGLGLTAIDPSAFAQLLPSSGGVHQWRPKQAKPATDWEARIDELFTQQAQETDPAARKQKFDEIQTIMAEEMPLVPIVSRHIVSASHERVGNLSPSSILPYSLWNADRLFIKQ